MQYSPPSSNLRASQFQITSQVLKDPNTADSYSMADGDIIHIVTVSTPAGQAAPAPAPISAPAAFPQPAAPQPQQSADPFAALPWGMPGAAHNSAANPFAAMMGGMGGMGGMGMPDMASMQAMLQQNPEMVGAMMDNPMVQQALENPGQSCSSLHIAHFADTHRAALIEAVMQANPQMRSIMESNPEVAQIMRDPAMLRQVCHARFSPLDSLLFSHCSARAWKSLAIPISCRK
jgi:ubiquilin